MSVPICNIDIIMICNCFRGKWANDGTRYTSHFSRECRYIYLFDARVRRPPWTYRGSQLGLLKSTFNAKKIRLTCLGCRGLFPTISTQFILKMYVSARNREKFTKTLYFVGSKSFKVIDVDTRNKLVTIVLVMIISISVPICNCFHARQANSGKKTYGVPLFHALVRGEPHHPVKRNFVTK